MEKVSPLVIARGQWCQMHWVDSMIKDIDYSKSQSMPTVYGCTAEVTQEEKWKEKTSINLHKVKISIRETIPAASRKAAYIQKSAFPLLKGRKRWASRKVTDLPGTLSKGALHKPKNTNWKLLGKQNNSQVCLHFKIQDYFRFLELENFRVFLNYKNFKTINKLFR